MKRFIGLFTVLCLYTLASLAQSRMIVDKAPDMTVSDDWQSISSLKELPREIVDSVSAALNSYLGEFNAHTKFYSGCIKSKKGANTDLSFAKYSLVYVLKDLPVGFKTYAINIDINKFGRVLSLNWPKYGYTTKEKFIPLSLVKDAVLNNAKQSSFKTHGYTVDFDFDKEQQKFIWTFYFLSKQTRTTKEYNVIKINWADLDDVKFSEMAKVTVY